MIFFFAFLGHTISKNHKALFSRFISPLTTNKSWANLSKEIKNLELSENQNFNAFFFIEKKYDDLMMERNPGRFTTDFS